MIDCTPLSSCRIAPLHHEPPRGSIMTLVEPRNVCQPVLTKTQMAGGLMQPHCNEDGKVHTPCPVDSRRGPQTRGIMCCLPRKEGG